MRLKYKTIIYIMISVFVVLDVFWSDLTNYESDFALYNIIWSYSLVALLYIPMYLYLCIHSIKNNLFPDMIVRYRKKGQVLQSIIIAVILEAFQMVFVLCVFTFVLYYIKFKINTDIIKYILLNFIMQFFAFSIFSCIMLLLIFVFNNYVAGLLGTIILVTFQFFSQSKTYVFSDLFFNLIGLFNYNFKINSFKVWYGILFKEIIAILLLYTLTIVVFKKKNIYGNIK